MKNIDLKKLVWRAARFIWNVCAVVGILVLILFFYIVFDDEGWCLSEGHGVWDREQGICRKDCLKWDDNLGCIKDINILPQ